MVMNRRDFLRPRCLAETTSQMLAVLATAPTCHGGPAAEVPLLRVSRRAMATTFEVFLPFGTPDGLGVAAAALAEVDRIEELLTVYRPQSPVSQLNRQAARQAVVVEEELYNLLEMVRRLSTETDGAFDVTAGALVKAWGFYTRQPRIPSHGERLAAMSRVGMQHLVLEPHERTVQYRQEGLEVNFGSVGKGYALDCAAACLRRWGVSSALLQGGHSSVYAVGAGWDGRGWPVGIKHPSQPRRLAIVRLRDQGLATSAATHQYLEHAGRRLGHLLDPRTGWPARGTASASVIAPAAAAADALATAFYVLGVDKAREYCQQRPGLAAVVLPETAEAPVYLGFEGEA